MNTDPRNGFPTFGAAARAQNRRSPIRSRHSREIRSRLLSRRVSRVMAEFAHHAGTGVFGK